MKSDAASLLKLVGARFLVAVVAMTLHFGAVLEWLSNEVAIGLAAEVLVLA